MIGEGEGFFVVLLKVCWGRYSRTRGYFCLGEFCLCSLVVFFGVGFGKGAFLKMGMGFVDVDGYYVYG